MQTQIYDLDEKAILASIRQTLVDLQPIMDFVSYEDLLQDFADLMGNERKSIGNAFSTYIQVVGLPQPVVNRSMYIDEWILWCRSEITQEMWAAIDDYVRKIRNFDSRVNMIYLCH